MSMLYQKAVNNQLQYHAEQISMIEPLRNLKEQWSDVKCLFTKKKTKSGGWVMKTGVPTGTIGVYRIIYKPTMETMSIGVGIVAQRLSTHRSIFINKGKIKVHKDTQTKSPTASHMYNYNRHRGNWLFNWCEIPNRALAGAFEEVLILTEQPKFNNLSMAGK